MANDDRPKAYSLISKLKDEPYNYDFFQVVRRLECVYRDLPRVGVSSFPDQDPVQFRQKVELTFAPAAIADYTNQGQDRCGQLWITFLGLLGPNGPMPLYLTEYIRNRLRNFDDKTLASFLDIFNNRMVSLFYRAWACNQAVVSFDRADEDYFSRYVGSSFGIGSKYFRHRDGLDDLSKLYYSGRLICQNKNAEGLHEVLKDYFNIHVEITQFIGQWKNIPKRYQCRLGESPDTGSLAETFVVGSRYWDCQEKFGLRIGPMSLKKYLGFIPGGQSLKRLIAWIRNYVGDEFTWDVQLVLFGSEVPSLKLGQFGQLGYTTWLKTYEFNENADDLTLSNLVA